MSDRQITIALLGLILLAGIMLVGLIFGPVNESTQQILGQSLGVALGAIAGIVATRRVK